MVHGTPLHCPIQISIVPHGGLEVCDGAHSLDVTKKVKGPAQAELVRGTLQGWNGREFRATRPPLQGAVESQGLEKRAWGHPACWPRRFPHESFPEGMQEVR